MSDTTHHCPLCGHALLEVEVGHGVIGFSYTSGSSELLIRPALERSRQDLPYDPEEEWDRDKQWMPFMERSSTAEGLYCTECGSLTIAPSIPAHRKELGLDS